MKTVKDKLSKYADKGVDKMFEAARTTARRAVAKIGPEKIVAYAKTRSDWKDWCAMEELTLSDSNEQIAVLFVQDYIYATFTDGKLV
jgi:hypothetical protein